MTNTITGILRPGNVELSASSKGLELSFTEQYHVLSTSKTETMWSVMSTAEVDPLNTALLALMPTIDGVPQDTLPFPGVSMGREGICICKKLTGEKDERNPLKWIFTGEFNSTVSEGKGGQQNGDPTAPLEDATPARETLYEMVTRNKTKDYVGNPYANGALSLYNPGLQIEEELPRWDFSQFDIDFNGTLSATSSTYAGLAAGLDSYSLLTEADLSVPGEIYPPGVYVNNGVDNVFYAPTDATIFYFNGCVNSLPFLGFPEYTLMLKVRSSKVSIYQGQRKRLTEYSVIYDKTNHWDKALNAGPFFIAPKLDDDGNEVGVEMVRYPYIYYTSDKESSDTDLAIDNDGLLGYRDLELSLNATTNQMEIPARQFDSASFAFGNSDAKPVADAVKVQLENNKWTWRANRPDADQTLYFIEFVNHDVLPFGSYLRIV